ncbi:MAG: hypothetical protein KKE17_07300 [Proteobacteria bacterium]|nr:hypothetical protein [Pseudomonadota bacterium]MBU1709794.1 hypothetical protein [Pseudomonadota bacterium]
MNNIISSHIFYYKPQPFLALKELGGNDIMGLVDLQDETRGRDEIDYRILCKRCNFQITSAKKKIEINGAHRHTFYNPEGVIYDIGCFSSAKGSHNHGGKSFYFTWFEGYSWCFSVCSSCLTHLGWYFEHSRDAGGFYGLVTSKLIEGQVC